MAATKQSIMQMADGGVWKLEAKKNIADYFKRELKVLIDTGDVVILA